MSKRISKKLMIGLGSTLTVATASVLSGLGIKALSNPFANQNQFNTINRLGFNDIPQANTASSSMFNLPKVSSVTLGNTQLGQTITPYGWLSRLDGNRSQLTLTGWNGELLWVTENFQDDYNGKVYDAKYDWNTDTILLIRYGHMNGGFWIPGGSQPSNLSFSLLDAKTGREIISKQRDVSEQEAVYNTLQSNFVNVRSDNNSDRFANLFNLDLASWENNDNQVIFNYTPNFMHLIEKNATDANHSLPSLKTVLSKYADLAKQIIFYKKYPTTGRPDILTLNFNDLISRSNNINLNNDTWTFNGDTLKPSEFALLINPFVTTGTNLGEFLIHFIVGNKAGRLLHKTFGFKVDQNGQTFLNQLDQTEEITDDIMSVLPDRWSNAKQWDDTFVNANLRVNRNIFNSNSVVVAYPYAANNQNNNNNYPVFNVVQLLIDPTTGLIKKDQNNNPLKTTNFDFGKQIYDYSLANPTNHIFNPWPVWKNSNWNSTNTNHNYNRLISVSPFDNTIIFAASPNFTNRTITSHNDHTYNWANFWIASTNNPNGKGNYHPLLISNDTWTGDAAIDTDMVDNAAGNVTTNLYNQGFTFDLASLMNDGSKKSLNLYFNTNPNRWQNYGGATGTVKIGLLDDVLKKDVNNTFWVDNVTQKLSTATTTQKPAFSIPITKRSFSTFLHARADLTQWYPRTWQNINKPANLYQVGEQINGNENNSTRVMARNYNKITDPNINTIEAVDLVSHWFDPTSQNIAPPNYDRLSVKRPQIKVAGNATTDANNQKGLVLPVETSWKPVANVLNKYQSIFNDAQKVQKLTLKKTEQLHYVAQQITESWGTNAKMTGGFINSTSNFNASAEIVYETNSNVGNSAPISAKFNKPLRLFLEIQKPSTNNWNFDNVADFFKKYPVEAHNDETSFATVLNAFVKWKTQNLQFNAAEARATDALQSLEIKAYLGLNNELISGQTNRLFTENNKDIALIDETNNGLVVFEDNSTQDRLVYKQMAPNFAQAHEWGWGQKGRDAVTRSWKSGSMPALNTQFKMDVDAAWFSDNLVRSGDPTGQLLFSVRYQAGSPDTLEISPLSNKVNEFNNRFKNFNQMTGLGLKFEYVTHDNPNTWVQLGNQSVWTDEAIRTNLQANNNKLVFTKTNQNIKQIRFRLVNLAADQNQNLFINHQNFSGNQANDNKFVSDIYTVNPKEILVDPTWFNQNLDVAQEHFLQNINANDFAKYEQAVFAQHAQFTPELQAKVVLKYRFKDQPNEAWKTKDQFVEHINRRLNNFNTDEQGLFSLLNDNNNGVAIEARLFKLDENDPTLTIIGQQNQPDGDTLAGQINTNNIQTKLDLQNYLTILQNQKTQATEGNQPGQLNGTFNPPSMSSGGQFGNKSFDFIVQRLKEVGITIEYQQWDLNTNNWESNWNTDKNTINQYNPAQPQIRFRFNSNQQFNVKLFNGASEITINDVFYLDLKLPKVVQISDALFDNFKTNQPFGGNTKDLTFNNQAEQNFIQAIINANNSATNSTNFNGLIDLLEIQYAIGTDNTYRNANDLKTYLSTLTTDITNNQILYKVALKTQAADPSDDGFRLDQNAITSHKLLEDRNTEIKKYIHGDQLESQLNQIELSGTLTNLTYVWTKAPLINDINRGAKDGLEIQYTYNAGLDVNNSDPTGNDAQTKWKLGPLPTSVPTAQKMIYVRLNVKTGFETEYVYGPQLENNRTKGQIDLANVIVPIKIDKAWINQFPLITNNQETDLNQVLSDTTFFDTFETNLKAKVDQINQASVSDKIKIVYQFENNEYDSSTELISAMKAYQSDFGAAHLGILQLKNGNYGLPVQAKFAKKTAAEKITFITLAGADNSDLTNEINTTNIITTVNLQPYVNVLESQKTAVVSPNLGVITSFTPPAMTTATPPVFLSGKTYEQIITRLKQIGIKALFRPIGTDQGNAWIEKDQVNKYDPTKGILELAFTNESTNIKLVLKANLEIPVQSNSQNNPIQLELNVPKQIQIRAEDYAAFIQDSGISGNTKHINIEVAKVNQLIQKIKAFNVQTSGNNDFNNAPLGVQFRLGSSDEFKEISDWKDYLATVNTDYTENKVEFRFVITGDQNKWSLTNDQPIVLFPNDQSVNAKLPIFVHDGGLNQNLMSNITFSGNNKKFNWKWPQNVTVDNDGTITSTPGTGLKIEFTFNANAGANDSLNNSNDPQVGWSNTIPTSFNLGQNQVWIRIMAKDGYVYELNEDGNNAQKIGLSLANLNQEIPLQIVWLNQEFNVANQFIDQISLSDIDAYETKVFQQLNGIIPQDIQNELEITYTFNNENNLQKTALLQKLQDYQNNHNGNDLGILILDNGTNNGKTISATFSLKNSNAKFDIVFDKPNQANVKLNTASIKTQINLTKVIIWLSNLRVAVVEGNQANSIDELKMNDLRFNDSSDSVFDGKKWNQIEQALEQVGLLVEYSNVIKNQQANWGSDSSSVNAYDDQGLFQIHFKLDPQKATNLKVTINATEVVEKDTTTTTSSAIFINLKVKKKIQLDQNWIETNFINQSNVITGNTKFLTINGTLENQMISAILQQNQNANPNAKPPFTSANLKVEYKLGNSGWMQREAFTNYLKASTTDQNTNEVKFRFVIIDQANQEADFGVDSAREFTLFAHSAPNTNPKIGYYINTANLETNAAGIQLSGTNNKPVWNWNGLNVQTLNNQAFITLSSGLEGLQVEFTAKANPQYNDPAALENGDIKQNWIKTIPTTIPADITSLAIRLVAQTGFIYEAQVNNNAAVHVVNTDTLMREIEVDHTWLNQEFVIKTNEKLLSELSLDVIKAYQNEVLKRINPNLKDKVQVVFSFKGQNNLTAEDLFQTINAVINANDEPEYGVLQLANASQNGEAISATFVLASGVDATKYTLVNINGQPDNLSDQVITENINSKIDLQAIVEFLINPKNKIEVVLDQTNPLVIKNIKMPKTPLDQTNPTKALSNLAWSKFETRLNALGITIEARAIMNNGNQPNWGPISNITTYDPNQGQIELHFVLNQTQGSNIILTTAANEQIDKNNNTSSNFRLTLDVPLTLHVSDALVQTFVNSHPITGNTKFLEIDEAKVEQLINGIIEENKQNNPLFALAKDRLFLEYQLGDGNANEWKNQTTFINDLKQTSIDQTTNQIQFRLQILNDKNQANDPDNYQIFQIDGSAHEVVQQQIGQQNAQIKIYINENGLENLADQTKVVGTNNNFTYQWAQGFQVDNQTGSVNQIKGLKIQYSRKQGIANQVYDGGTNKNPDTGWVNEQVQVIDPANRYLAIQLVATDGYVYGPETQLEGPNWSVHQIDTEKIQSEIKLSNQGLTAITFSGELPNFNKTNIQNQLEQKAKDHAQFENVALQDKVKLEYQLVYSDQQVSAWSTLDQLEILIQNYLADYNNQTLSILKFGTENNFAQIKARFISNNEKFVVLDRDANTNDAINSAQNGKVVNTSALITPIDLQAYVQVLKTVAVTTGAGSTSNQINDLMPPAMTAGSGFLNGKTFKEIEQALNKVGIKVEFYAPGSSTNGTWIAREAIRDLNQQNELYLRFRVEMDHLNSVNDKNSWAASFKILLNNNQAETLNNANEYATTPFRLKVALPIVLSVDPQTEIAGFSFEGNTWTINNLTEVESKTSQIITNVLNQNSTGQTDVTKAPLKIEFSLGGQIIANNQTWFEAAAFVDMLKQSNQNWNTNEILARYALGSTQPGAQEYQLSNTNAITLQAKNETASADLKMYIHGGNYDDQNQIRRTLLPTGSTENYTISGIENWLLNVPQGLSVQFSADQTTWNDYQDNQSLPKPLNNQKQLWMRFKVAEAYEYQNASQSDKTVSEPIELDTANLKLIIKLQKAWLHEITISGNTKNVNDIDETQAQTQINNAQVLPPNKPELIRFEYSIDGQTWLPKTAFIEYLKNQNGAKDPNNRFIILREDIQVRFAINSADDVASLYGLNIDGTDVTVDNYANFNVQMVDQSHNQSFEGYINVDLLADLQLNNFSITGTTSKPLFNVVKAQKLNTLLQSYASNNLFNIELATTKQANGDWNWEANKSLLNPTSGALIGKNGLISQNVTLTGDKFFAIRFISKNNNYKVYANDRVLTDGKIIDLSANVHVTVEIENPFVTNNKSIGVQFRDDQKQAKYYQGAGGFKAVVSWINGVNTTQSVQNFLANSQLSNNEKDALEFVYHVFETQPTEEEFNAVAAADVINDYQGTTWKKLSEVVNSADGDFTKALNLKVNQFVTIALRVKQTYAEADDAYVLKDNQHSVLDPVGFGANTTQKLSGRVSGYKVAVDQLKINQDEIVLSNMNYSQSTPIDGFTLLQRINFNEDDLGNYLGVELNVKLYDQFHRDAKGQILTVGNQKLVKRSQGTNIVQKGTYQNSDGTPVVDAQGQPIPILVDALTGKLSAPEAANNATYEKQLEDFGNGVFGFNVVNLPDAEFGLFKNQKVEIEYLAKAGLNSNGQPDFELDKNFSIDIQDWISPQIKYPIENLKNISYSFIQDDFNAENISYAGNNPLDPNSAVSGASHVATPLKLRRIEGASSTTTVISANSISESVKALETQLAQDFANQLQFEYTYVQADGPEITKTGANIYQENKLKNGDKIILKIVATDPDLVYLEAPAPLIISVRGLIGTAPDREKLRFLRVEQSGQIDGQGSFRVLVNDPNQDNINDDVLLRGWKFMVQVWNQKQEIKIAWTDDQNQIKGLENGDKVEWKLVDERNNHVQDAYYNTVALEPDFNPSDGSINYNFAQVNYTNGAQSQKIYHNGIGQYPATVDTYPLHSGYVISGLETAIEKFSISETGFVNVFDTLDPTYSGINGQGALRFDEQYLNELYYVDTNGRLNARPLEMLNLQADGVEQLEQISLNQFLEHVTFFTADPRLEPLQNGFKFNSNDTNITNYLKNGDQLWAQFDVVQQGSNGLVSTTLTTQLPDVSGLSDVPDAMGPLWFVLMGAGAILTLGFSTLAYFWIRHRKLK